MPVSNIRGVNINWQVIGDRGPWVMATTGGRRGHDEFIPMAQKIARHGFRVMLHDRRNTGASDLWIDGDEGEEAPWLPDMHELMRQNDALPAFFCGSSAGARTSIRFYLKYPQAVRGLLLLRVTGGEFAAKRLPENYYGQFIKVAKESGMAAVIDMDAWKERFKENPRGREYLGQAAGGEIHRGVQPLEGNFRGGRQAPGHGRFRAGTAVDQSAGHDHSWQRPDSFERQRRRRTQTHSGQRNLSVADHRPGSAADSVPGLGRLRSGDRRRIRSLHAAHNRREKTAA